MADTTETTQTPDRKAGLQAVRRWVKDRVREHAALTALDEMLDDAGELTRVVAAKKSEIAAAEGELTAVQQRTDALRQEGEQIIATARTEAQRLADGAQAQRGEAAKVKREADAVLIAAKAEAEKIIADAKGRADRVTAVAKKAATDIAGASAN